MAEHKRNDIVRLEAAQVLLRRHFLGWQCRVRQHIARQCEGRPNAGIRPRLAIGGEPVADIVVLINKLDPEEVTKEFRHFVLRTTDPAEHYKSALRVFSELYYQLPDGFSDVMTALFGPSSSTVQRVHDAGQCELQFDFQRQSYRLPCFVARLAESDPTYQATYWHNRLFNRAMPPGVEVLSFSPDWSRAQANPDPCEKLSASTHL